MFCLCFMGIFLLYFSAKKGWNLELLPLLLAVQIKLLFLSTLRIFFTVLSNSETFVLFFSQLLNESKHPEKTIVILVIFRMLQK